MGLRPPGYTESIWRALARSKAALSLGRSGEITVTGAEAAQEGQGWTVHVEEWGVTTLFRTNKDRGT